MRTDIDALIILAQTKSKKLEILLCKDAGHLALFRVHFQLQLAFQILPAGFQQTLCCAFALGKHHNIICIPKPLTPLRLISQSNSLRLIFACKGDNGPPCGEPSSVFADHTIPHYTAFQILLN